MKKKQWLKRAVSMLVAAGIIFTTIFQTNVIGLAAEVQEGTSKDANAYAIYPIPQDIDYTAGEFTLGDSVVVVAEAGIDQYTKDYLCEVLDAYEVKYTEASSMQSGKTNILLGIHNSNGVADQYVTENLSVKDEDLFEKADAYLLDAKEDCIVICGKDTDAAYHGVATLKMMFSSFAGEKFLDAHIEDYACVATRGYIEGFYGSWDFEERENLMWDLRDYKLNSYVYAAKGDAYHTNKWAELYPADMLEDFETLVEAGNKTKVRFAWSVHLGSFFSGLDLNDTATYEERYAKLIAKMEQLYDIGVRKFDVLNDDFGSGSHETVVTVLNRLNADLKEMGCESLVYCPQGYNKAWSGNGEELAALKNLDEDIYIYWTGDDVNAPITQSTIDFVTEKSGHQPDFWLNFPVNEHAKSGIFLGDITYYARDNVTGLAGFHSNPSRYAYANEVGLYQLAALVWNNHDYSEYANEIWESAFNYLQPEVKDSYFTIAKNIANAPNSSRVPGFNESEYLAETLKTVQDLVEAGEEIATSQEAQALVAEFANIISAIADFREHCANQDLVGELDPWLNSLDDLAHAGLAALESLIALEDGNASLGWEKLSSASQYYDTAYTYMNEVPTEAKAGTKRLSPFIGKMISAATNNLTPILNPNDDTFSPIIFAQIGGIVRNDDDNAKKLYDGNEETFASWNTDQQAGDYFGLDLGRAIPVRDITILQGSTDEDHDIFHDAVVQYSTDKENWTEIDCEVSKDGHLIQADGLEIRARYIRYYLRTTGYGNKANFWTHVREFIVNRVEKSSDRVYTNIAALKETPLTLEDTKVSIRNLNNLTLQPGEYVGIKLEQPTAVSAFTKEISNETGLAFEYSYNEQDWTATSQVSDAVAVKYLRLVNKSTSAVTTNLQKIEMALINLKAEPQLLNATIANGLGEGSYADIFDGDLSTYILTAGTQQSDTYMTFDLGKMLEVHDVTAVTTDGAERFYNAKIQISKDNKNWTDIAVVANDNSVFEVPYRYVRCDAEGETARYLRIYFTGTNANKLKLYELQINEKFAENTAVSEVVSSISGNVNAVTDNNISTALAGNVQSGDYLEYRISENTNVKQVSVLQGKGGNGKLYAITASGKVELGILDESVSTFDTTSIAPVKAVRIEWSAEENVAIHGISLVKGASNSTDIGVFVEPIVVEGEEPISNIAIGKTVTVSGTSDGNKDNVNDGNPDSKWDSNAIKGTNASDNAWIYIDLGEIVYEVNQIIVSYYNKIYPTAYELQTSDDAQNWTTVKSFTKPDNGATHPVDVIDLEETIQARYIRLYFTSLNTAAAGNGVGIKEFEIYGRRYVEKPVESITEKQDLSTGKPITVSGTSNGQAAYINDGNGGNEGSKWDSNLIKRAGEGNVAWFAIDLGEKVNLIDELNVQYFNKVYPTQYEVQVSNDNENWSTVKVLEKAHNGATYPKDSIVFETPVSARYIKMLFTEMNSAAAGDGIGITEATVLGRYINVEATVVESATLPDIEVTAGTTFDNSSLKEMHEIKVAVKNVAETIAVKVPVQWDVKDLDMETAGVYVVEGDLQLNGIANTNSIVAGVKVIVKGVEVEYDYTVLDEQIALAETIEEELYTPETYEPFKSAFDNAKAVRENAPSQETINIVAETLKEAREALVVRADKSVLESVIAEAAAIDKNTYTEESYAVLTEALTVATEVKENLNATTEEVEAAIEALRMAMEQLAEKSQEPDEGEDEEPSTQEELVRAFVERMYTIILGRDADPNGLNDWAAGLIEWRVDGAGIVNGFANSDEFVARNLSDEDFIKTLYLAVLNREADENGLADWLRAFELGYTRQMLIDGFVTSAEFIALCDSYGILAEITQKHLVTSFVERMYTVALDREADAAGLEYWVTKLMAGSTDGKTVVNGFVGSEEFEARGLNDEDFIKTLYRTILGREANEADVASWIAAIELGQTRTQIMNGFIESAEFAYLCDGYGISAILTQRDLVTNFVERMYTVALGREADANGLNDWVTGLIDGVIYGAQVADGFIMSAEFEARGLSNEDYIKTLYLTFFNREAGDADVEGWVSAMTVHGQSRRDVLRGFINAEEFRVLCENYGIIRGTLSN